MLNCWSPFTDLNCRNLLKIVFHKFHIVSTNVNDCGKRKVEFTFPPHTNQKKRANQNQNEDDSYDYPWSTGLPDVSNGNGQRRPNRGSNRGTSNRRANRGSSRGTSNRRPKRGSNRGTSNRRGRGNRQSNRRRGNNQIAPANQNNNDQYDYPWANGLPDEQNQNNAVDEQYDYPWAAGLPDDENQNPVDEGQNYVFEDDQNQGQDVQEQPIVQNGPCQKRYVIYKENREDCTPVIREVDNNKTIVHLGVRTPLSQLRGRYRYTDHIGLPH